MGICLSLTTIGAFGVFAEQVPVTGNQTITISNPVDGHTYQAYQIFIGNLTLVDDTKASPTTADYILSNIEWGNGVTEAGKTAIAAGKTAAAYAADSLNDSEDARDLADALVAGNNYLQNPISFDNNNQASVAPGYYLIKDATNVTDAEGGSITQYVVQVVAPTDITLKVGTTTSDKKVKDVDDTTGTPSDWQKSADYDIGDEVPFQLTATLPANYTAYKTYSLTFHDKESAGLDFISTSVKVYKDSVNENNLINVANYTLVENPNDGCTFEIKFSKENLTAINATDSTTIIVEYKSTLNSGAIRGQVGNTNESWVSYNNNPNSEQGGEPGTTPHKTVIVFTFDLDLNKVKKEGNTTVALKGAEFTLEKNKSGTWTSITLNKVNNNHEFTADGLDDGFYRLTETKTPDGYNALPGPIYFKVTATHDPTDGTTAALTGLTVQETDESGNVKTGNDVQSFSIGTYTIDQNNTSATGTILTDILNEKGAVLPSTGGIGTTIFYIIGVVLLAGAAIILVTRRRMNAE